VDGFWFPQMNDKKKGAYHAPRLVTDFSGRSSRWQKALETGNVSFILPYVPKESEGEVIAAFKKVLPLHQQPNGAQEIADTFFFETVVRIHRAGEGAPYTGLKPAGMDEGPVIPIAEQAIETGSIDELKKTLMDLVGREVEKRFEHMQHLKHHTDESVDMGASTLSPCLDCRCGRTKCISPQRQKRTRKKENIID
jgi:hypothetical protein